MSRFKTPDVEENVGCNLIPMIDVMFLLLLFFMLGADMSNRELEEVKLPLADQVKEDPKMKEAGKGDRTTVNIYHPLVSTLFTCSVYGTGTVCRDHSHWLIAIRSNVYTLDNVKERLALEAQRELEDDPIPGTNKHLSKQRVMIRGDQHAPFGYIQKVIEACAAVGIYQIEIGAAQPVPAG